MKDDLTPKELDEAMRKAAQVLQDAGVWGFYMYAASGKYHEAEWSHPHLLIMSRVRELVGVVSVDLGDDDEEEEAESDA